MIKNDMTPEPTQAELDALQEQLWATEVALYEREQELFGDEYADFILSTIA